MFHSWVGRESGGVTEELGHRDFARIRMKVLGFFWENVRHRGFPSEFLFFDQPCDQGGGHRLGIRANVPE